jgi:uncharacterized protein
MFDTARLFYYKSSAGHEIDLVYETGGIVHAIEIKSSRTFNRRDIRSLIFFRENAKRPVRSFLFYLGEEYHHMDGVTVLPMAALFRGV